MISLINPISTVQAYILSTWCTARIEFVLNFIFAWINVSHPWAHKACSQFYKLCGTLPLLRAAKSQALRNMFLFTFPKGYIEWNAYVPFPPFPSFLTDCKRKNKIKSFLVNPVNNSNLFGLHPFRQRWHFLYLF